MEKNKLLDLAFSEWKAGFKASSGQEKKTKNARSNFENLFQRLKDLEADFNEAEPYLAKAIKVHQPTPSRARDVYRNLHNKMGKNEKEFVDEWNESIEAIGTDVFFELFPATTTDHDSEPKVYGNMSATEYKAQRRYADQFPTLDTTELVKQWKIQQEYNLDVEKTLENVLGNNDETDS